MVLNAIDWTVIAVYFVISLVVGLYYSKRAGKNVESYFLSDRSVPWWLLGVSMVATTFAADTPLAVTGMVANHGIAGNWLWWSFAFSGILTVFFYARLWRRAEVMTDVEFTEIRYAGRSAAVDSPRGVPGERTDGGKAALRNSPLAPGTRIVASWWTSVPVHGRPGRNQGSGWN